MADVQTGRSPLRRGWWLFALRGAWALLFGVVALLRPGMSLGAFVLAFGAYALVDGAAAVAQAVWGVERPRQGAPLLVEGAVSVALGVAAWGWPFQVPPRLLSLGSVRKPVNESSGSSVPRRPRIATCLPISTDDR